MKMLMMMMMMIFILSSKPQCPSVLHTSVWMVVSSISQLDPHSCAPHFPASLGLIAAQLAIPSPTGCFHSLSTWVSVSLVASAASLTRFMYSCCLRLTT